MIEILEHKIVRYLQNMVRYFKFYIKHPDFWHKQIYKLSNIYNKNEQ